MGLWGYRAIGLRLGLGLGLGLRLSLGHRLGLRTRVIVTLTLMQTESTEKSSEEAVGDRKEQGARSL